MSINFLVANGAQRMSNYSQQPTLLDNENSVNDESEDDSVDLDYEQHHDHWGPIGVGSPYSHRDWHLRPQRFVDGKDSGRIVAWLRSKEGYPIPIRLSQIG